MAPKEAHVSASKFLALVLRHKPEEIEISLDEHGWADVNELVQGMSKRTDLSLDVLEEIVATDSKQRYSFNEDRTLIRANQGHSIEVDVELEQKTPPPVLYHGTGEKYAPSIEKSGLMPKSRLYVHLSSDFETAAQVGARHGSPIVYAVDAATMHEHGHAFFLSRNGVWLAKSVPAEYLSAAKRE